MDQELMRSKRFSARQVESMFGFITLSWVGFLISPDRVFHLRCRERMNLILPLSRIDQEGIASQR